MDAATVAALYMASTETYSDGADMYCIIELRQPLDADAFFAVYRRLVQEQVGLRAQYAADPRRRRHGYRPLEAVTVTRLLEAEARRWRAAPDLAAVCNEPARLNSVLPVRFRLLGPDRLVMLVHHVFYNGQGMIAWLRYVLRAYASATGETVGPEPMPTPRRASAVPTALAGYGGCLRYLTGFLAAYHHRGRPATVDLSAGRRPRSGRFELAYHVFSAEQTARLLTAARGAGGINVYLAQLASAELFALQPQRRWVCLSIPADLHHAYPERDARALGNYTGSLIVQLFVGDDLNRQLRQAFGWLRRAVPLFLGRLVGLGRDEAGLLRQLTAAAARPVDGRGPLANFSLALSNVGVVRDPLLERYAVSVSISTRAQALFLGCVTANGRLSLSVGYPAQLYEPATVATFFSRLLARLDSAAAGAQSSSSNGNGSAAGTGAAAGAAVATGAAGLAGGAGGCS